MNQPAGDSHLSGQREALVIRMRVRWSLVPAALFCLSLFGNNDFRELSRVHTVYIMAMANGLDQFLANRFTNAGVLWVVLDPAKADAILTDRLDEEFWKW